MPQFNAHFKKILFILLAIHLVVATPSIAAQGNATATQEQQNTQQQERLNKQRDAWDKESKNLGTFQDCKLCPEMAILPPGEFIAGPRDNEDARTHEYHGPQMKVTIDYSFAIGVFEVTRDEYNVCVAAGDCQPRLGSNISICVDDKCEAFDIEAVDRAFEKKNDKAYPIDKVSWGDAKAYVAWLSKLTGKTYRLPSAREWEYAARAGSKTIYWWGDEIGTDGKWCVDCSFRKRLRMRPTWVGRFKPNPFGLYDVEGNVTEWAEDCYEKGIKPTQVNGSPYLSGNCEERVLVGGSVINLPRQFAHSVRGGVSPKDRRRGYVGFRVVAEISN